MIAMRMSSHNTYLGIFEDVVSGLEVGQSLTVGFLNLPVKTYYICNVVDLITLGGTCAITAYVNRSCVSENRVKWFTILMMIFVD